MREKWREHLQGWKETRGSPCTSHFFSPRGNSKPSCAQAHLFWAGLGSATYSCLPARIWPDSALPPPPAVYTTGKPGAASRQVSQGQHHPASSTKARSKSCLPDRLLPWNEAQRTQQPTQGSKSWFSQAVKVEEALFWWSLHQKEIFWNWFYSPDACPSRFKVQRDNLEGIQTMSRLKKG